MTASHELVSIIPQGMKLSELERIVIEDSMRRHEGWILDVAEELGISPRTIQRRLRHFAKLDAYRHPTPDCRLQRAFQRS